MSRKKRPYSKYSRKSEVTTEEGVLSSKDGRVNEKSKPEPPIEKPRRSKVKYREVVYVGTADKSTTNGAVTGKSYEFFRDAFGMPKSTKVDEKDYMSIISIKGKGCARRDPNALYMSKYDWDLDIQKAKVANR